MDYWLILFGSDQWICWYLCAVSWLIDWLYLADQWICWNLCTMDWLIDWLYLALINGSAGTCVQWSSVAQDGFSFLEDLQLYTKYNIYTTMRPYNYGLGRRHLSNLIFSILLMQIVSPVAWNPTFEEDTT